MKKQRAIRIEGVLRNKTAAVVPILEEQNTRDDLPVIVNVVVTVGIFPPKSKQTHRFPLEAIATQIGGNVQYGPLNLPADVLRIRDSISDSTALVFRSGKLVIVRCLSWEHSRFCCHYYRMMLERIQCVMRDSDDGNRLKLTTLEGRTQFENWEVHNSVGYGQLGCRVDLAALREAAPHVCQYKPDVFPGLKLKVWVSDPSKCTCKKIKCPCKVQMLIFDTGKVIIVGARSTRVINSVFYRFKSLVPKYVDYGSQLPRKQRFEARVARLLGTQNVGVNAQEQVQGTIEGLTHGGVAKKRRKKEDTDENEELYMIINAIEQHAQSKTTGNVAGADIESPFIRACLDGQFLNVQWMLDMNREQHMLEMHNGQTALELLLKIPEGERTEEQSKILHLLS